MTGKMLYKSRSFDAFFKSAVLISAVFLISVFLGTIMGQFSNCQNIDSDYGNGFSVIDILKSSVYSLRIVILVGVCALIPKISFLEIPLIFVYGFSFAYSLCAVSLIQDFWKMRIFWDLILTFAAVFPALFFLSAKLLPGAGSNGTDISGAKLAELFFLLILVLFCIKSVLTLFSFFK